MTCSPAAENEHERPRLSFFLYLLHAHSYPCISDEALLYDRDVGIVVSELTCNTAETGCVIPKLHITSKHLS